MCEKCTDIVREIANDAQKVCMAILQIVEIVDGAKNAGEEDFLLTVMSAREGLEAIEAQILASAKDANDIRVSAIAKGVIAGVETYTAVSAISRMADTAASARVVIDSLLAERS